MTHHTPRGLPPLPQGTKFHSMDKDPASDGFMPFKVSPLKTWFTADQMQAYAEAYAREALAAQAATLEAICKIIECAGPEAADEIADLLGYPSVEWPSDQALTAPNLACKSAQARLATQWGYVRAASVEPVGKIINSGGNTGSLPEHPAPSPAQAVDAVDAVDELREALRGLLASGGVIADASPDELQAALSDPESEPIVKTQAAAVLRARAALQASRHPQAQHDRGDLSIYKARWCFALAESDDWTYAVCKWDGADWLPIKTEDDLRIFDAALATKEPK